ncbi:MAG TPA: hypothetical protein PLI12_04125, partial [Acetobacteraceae bacterium]|nr:hypothetical protein [Acetobacteraceae bacterium]
MRWVDISAYEMRIRFVDYTNGDNRLSRRLVVRGAYAEAYPALEAMGFEQTNVPDTWFKRTETLDLSVFRQVMPDLREIDVNPADIFVSVDIVTRIMTPTPQAYIPTIAAAYHVDERVAAGAPAEVATELQAPVVAQPIGTPLPRARNTDRRLDTTMPAGARVIYALGELTICENEAGLRYARDRDNAVQGNSWVAETNMRGHYRREVALRLDPTMADYNQHVARAIEDHIKRIVAHNGTVENTLDLAFALGFGDSLEEFSIRYREAMLSYGIDKAVMRDRLNLDKLFDIMSRTDFHTTEELPAPIAAALYRVSRTLPAEDRNAMLTVWNPAYNRICEIRPMTAPNYASLSKRDLHAARAVIADLSHPAEPLREPVEIDGVMAHNYQQVALLEILTAREAGSGKVMIAWGQDAEAPNSPFWRELARRYTVEGRTIVSAALTDMDRPVTLISFGDRRRVIEDEPHEASLTINHASTWSSVRQWAGDIIVSREKIKRYYQALNGDVRTETQVPYISLSRARRHSMVPRNLEEPLREAM